VYFDAGLEYTAFSLMASAGFFPDKTGDFIIESRNNFGQSFDLSSGPLPLGQAHFDGILMQVILLTARKSTSFLN